MKRYAVGLGLIMGAVVGLILSLLLNWDQTLMMVSGGAFGVIIGAIIRIQQEKE